MLSNLCKIARWYVIELRCKSCLHLQAATTGIGGPMAGLAWKGAAILQRLLWWWNYPSGLSFPHDEMRVVPQVGSHLSSSMWNKQQDFEGREEVSDTNWAGLLGDASLQD